jgi:hypothetical protein
MVFSFQMQTEAHQNGNGMNLETDLPKTFLILYEYDMYLHKISSIKLAF